MCFHQDIFVGSHFCEVENTSCFHVHLVPYHTVLPVPDFRVLPLQITFSVFRILDLLFCVCHVAIMAFDILSQPQNWLCSTSKETVKQWKWADPRLWRDFPLQMALYIVFLGKSESLLEKVSPNVCQNLFLKFRNFLPCKTLSLKVYKKVLRRRLFSFSWIKIFAFCKVI